MTLASATIVLDIDQDPCPGAHLLREHQVDEVLQRGEALALPPDERPESFLFVAVGDDIEPARLARLNLDALSPPRTGCGVSPWPTPSCRYQPSCSAYAITAIERYGAARGGWMALKRICRCHPWGTSGFDPVPKALPSHARWWRPWTFAARAGDDSGNIP